MDLSLFTCDVSQLFVRFTRLAFYPLCVDIIELCRIMFDVSLTFLVTLTAHVNYNYKIT